MKNVKLKRRLSFGLFAALVVGTVGAIVGSSKGVVGAKAADESFAVADFTLASATLNNGYTNVGTKHDNTWSYDYANNFNSGQNHIRFSAKSTTQTGKIYTTKIIPEYISKVSVTVLSMSQSQITSWGVNVYSNVSRAAGTLIDANFSISALGAKTYEWPPLSDDYWPANSVFEFTATINNTTSTNGTLHIQRVELFGSSTLPDPNAPSIAITSTDPQLSVGGTATLVATTENAEGAIVSWSSSNEAVAAVNSSTGLVAGVGVGSATITAKITVDEIDYTHTLVITIVPAYINADIAAILEGDDVKTIAYTGIARIKGWNTTGADPSPGQYGNMLLVDLIGGAEIQVYGATADQTALSYTGTSGLYAQTSRTTFLTYEVTKDLDIGDVIHFVAIRDDYQGTPQIRVIILRQADAYDEAEVFADWVMSYEGGDISTHECEDKFYDAWELWDELSAEAQDSFMTHEDFEDALARVRMWAIANGGNWDSDVVEYGGSPLARTTIPNSPERSLSAALIIGLFGLTTLAGYYFLQKRKVI